MEKRTAHYDLKEIQATVSKRGIDSFTKTALLGIDTMGLTQAQGLRVVLDLHRNLLFKSMTTHADTGFGKMFITPPAQTGKQRTSK